MRDRKDTLSFCIVTALIFLSRLPFINLGYGAEEDAWGLRRTAESISRNGTYEVSRLPGHPFQELIYTQIWPYGYCAFNLLTALISTAGILFFMLAMKKLKIKAILPAGVILAFTPVIYINSVNAMDYMWALSFILISFYLIVTERMLIAGVFLGWAIGCRITSGAVLLPFLFYCIDYRNFRETYGRGVRLISSTLIVACLAFWPVYDVYGPSFFQYYEHFPIPGFAKNLFKGTIGVWGTLGLLMMVTGFIYALWVMYKKWSNGVMYREEKVMTIVCLVTILLYIIAFARMPLKSAFMIPVIPFFILLIAQNVTTKWMYIFAGIMVLSSFTFGMNLADNYRGSEESSLAQRMNIAGQEISLDPLYGPVTADYTKQKRFIHSAMQVIDASQHLGKRSVIISGWYLNFILVLAEGKQSDDAAFVYYIDEETILSYIKSGYDIYYLPLQEQFNDLRFRGSFTKKYGKPLLKPD